MFRSYEAGRAGYVTLIANYLPLQDAYGGPNYFTLDPDALYEIHIDNDGDAHEDITFQFRFKNTLQRHHAAVGRRADRRGAARQRSGRSASDRLTATLNVIESYTVERDPRRPPHRHARRTRPTRATGGAIFAKPVDNIGTKSIPDYAAYAAQHIYDDRDPGLRTPGRVFVGQRKDPSSVNLGEIFDLVNLEPARADRDGRARTSLGGQERHRRSRSKCRSSCLHRRRAR